MIKILFNDYIKCILLEVNAKGFYLLLNSIALRTLSHSSLRIHYLNN